VQAARRWKENPKHAGVFVGCLGICRSSLYRFFVALSRRHRVNQQIITRSHSSRCLQLVLPPPTVAKYFPGANKDGNRGYGRAKRYFRLNGNCADLSDIIVDLEERIAWH
jgi:hypothetical protein